MEGYCLFDQLFDRIEGLLHYPWVGRDYLDSKAKVLILGDSHYATDEDGSPCEEEYNRCLQNKDYTREVLNCTIGEYDIWSMFKGLYSLFGVTPFSAEKSLWNKVAFCNFVQKPMKTRSAKPTTGDFKQAWFCLLDIIDIIHPDVCLFVGTRGWVSNGFINLENRGYCSLVYDTVRINGCTPWRATISTKNGVNTRAIAIHHTSQGFTPERWREYLISREPLLFSSLVINDDSMKRVYFAGSIRGGRADAELYRRMIAYIQREHVVLTEHVGDLSLSKTEGLTDRDVAIYEQDTAWLREADLVIAECTTPSLGVGYELAYAEKIGKPVHIFYNKSRTRLSAMLTGNSYFNVHPYDCEEDLFALLDSVFK